MPSILHTRADKELQVDFLRRICQHYLFHGATPPQRLAILEHLQRMGQAADDLIVGAKLEIDEGTGLTRITLETALASKTPRLA